MADSINKSLAFVLAVQTLCIMRRGMERLTTEALVELVTDAATVPSRFIPDRVHLAALEFFKHQTVDPHNKPDWLPKWDSVKGYAYDDDLPKLTDLVGLCASDPVDMHRGLDGEEVEPPASLAAVEQKIKVTRDQSDDAVVLVRSCGVTGAIDTELFGSVGMAMDYCKAMWGVDPNAWDAYLVGPDPESTMKLNGDPVSFVGWRYEGPELPDQLLHIHRVKKVVEF